MSELFTALYRYRQREKKNNFEDWLTECVAAIFRAMPKPVFSEFFSRLTGQPADAIAGIYERVSIATQVTIERGTTGSQRPDLVISIAAPEMEGKKEPSQPWLLFENKVSHHVDEQELETGETENQLHRYGSWLQQQSFDRHGLHQALIFVTHQTPAPRDFLAKGPSHPAYGELGRVTKTWGEIADLLETVSSEFAEDIHFRALIKAYQTFLEEHGMEDVYPEYRHYSALADFVENVEPFNKLVNEMIGKLDIFAPFNGRTVWAHADTEHGRYYAYRYLAKSKKHDELTYIDTGIWFPDRGDGWYSEDVEVQTNEPVSLSPKVFIHLANDEDEALTLIVGKPEGEWLRVNSDFFTFRDVTSFPPKPADAANTILAWVEAEGAKLKFLLSNQTNQ
jgi:hypothetical protein